jgi:hypothetical protein
MGEVKGRCLAGNDRMRGESSGIHFHERAASFGGTKGSSEMSTQSDIPAAPFVHMPCLSIYRRKDAPHFLAIQSDVR